MKLDERTLMLLALAGAAAAVYWFVIRPAGAVVGAVADAGRTINDDIIPGPGSLGTATYDAVNWVRGLFGYGDPDPTAPTPITPRPGSSSTPYDYGYGAGTGPLRPGLSAPDPADPFAFFWGT